MAGMLSMSEVQGLMLFRASENLPIPFMSKQRMGIQLPSKKQLLTT